MSKLSAGAATSAETALHQAAARHLAEATRASGAQGLQDDLRLAGMGPFGGLVHARLAASGPRHPLLGGRAALATVVGEREGMAGEARVVGARQSELDY